MTTTGLTIKQKGNRIEVDSKYYNEDAMYQDVTIDTYIKNKQFEDFKSQIYNICKPETI